MPSNVIIVCNYKIYSWDVKKYPDFWYFGFDLSDGKVEIFFEHDFPVLDEISADETSLDYNNIFCYKKHFRHF